jgi:hypothetical protein
MLGKRSHPSVNQYEGGTAIMVLKTIANALTNSKDQIHQKLQKKAELPHPSSHLVLYKLLAYS